MDDGPLVASVLQGNTRAFTVLAARHQRTLYATAYAMLGSSWDAADAVQEALLAAYARLSSLNDPERFGAWLTVILCNTCRDVRKRRRPTPTDIVPEGEAHEFVGCEESLDVIEALRGLSEDDRTVLALRFFRDLKVDEIAALLECPAGTVKSRINRALGRLRREMGSRPRLEVL